MKTRWVRVIGAGLVYEGPCLLHSVTLFPEGGDDWTDVYDGRDATSGKPFVTLFAKTRVTRQLTFGAGVPFDQGIYVGVNDAENETTVVFTPL